MNETNVLFLTGLFFIVAMVALASIWFSQKGATSENKEPSRFRRLLQLFYVVLDVTLFLTIKYCLYSTILNILYLLLFLLSMLLGITIKKYVERLVGLQETIQISLGFAVIGIILFAITPKFSIILGIPMGILLSQQIQSNHLLFNSPPLGKKSFLYSLLLAVVPILLIPSQYHTLFIYLIAIIFTAVSLLIIILFKNSHLIYFSGFSSTIRFWYPKGVVFGITLMLLLNPTYAPERFFFHAFWGLENFPTTETIAFAVASSYLIVILLSELLRLKHISISKSTSLLAIFIGLLCYIFGPFLIQNPLIFIASHLLFIFGLLTFLDNWIISSLPFCESPKKLADLSLRNTDPRGFTIQFLFWLIFGLFLLFVPPTIIVVDSQAAFTFLGLTGIEQLSWSPLLWTFFYIPSTYIFLAIPLIFYVLIFGIISTISKLL